MPWPIYLTHEMKPKPARDIAVEAKNQAVAGKG